MIPDASKALVWLKAHPNAIKGIRRGIERETLRVTLDGKLATTDHPLSLGSALTHKWITTDFTESSLELITPVDRSVDHLLTFLRDIHRYVVRKLHKERMWPFSMPCIIENDKNIPTAKYGNSNIGRMKMIYRKGLKNRYGAIMQTISGVHYNFSLPLSFWKDWAAVKDEKTGKKAISEGYLHLIRNYYRFGWVIPYLFGSSPAVYANFMHGKKSNLPFEYNKNNTIWLPYATSLRLSDLGYTDKSQVSLNITFNTLDGYINALRKAIKTPSAKYSQMGVKDSNGRWIQLNTNVLQIENELYTQIRPKRWAPFGRTLTDILRCSGIEYIEIRSLDINPFSPIGIDAIQVHFLDLFLIWCILADAPSMSNDELNCIRKNWNCVLLEGRKPNQIITMGCEGIKQSLVEVGRELFINLNYVAEILDFHTNEKKYQKICNRLIVYFEDPSITYSARVLQEILKDGIVEHGLVLAEQHHQNLLKESLEVLTEEDFIRETFRSRNAQKELEIKDTISFEDFLLNIDYKI